MTEQPPKPETRPHRATSKTHQQVKAERLNAALRDNLRRRKAAAEDNASISPASTARRAPGSNPPSSSEAVGHEKSHHDKTNENDA